MEIEGHPTQDLVEELERRGGLVVTGTSLGPNPDTLKFLHDRIGETAGSWLFLPTAAFATGFDEIPG